jgi:hypothetical protein
MQLIAICCGRRCVLGSGHRRHLDDDPVAGRVPNVIDLGICPDSVAFAVE